ncbi:histidine phosphatase family protein [Albibacillus kandeliae]|uniref:histidine phosphatase family protein n=1 Tax=Albibacillus kandeliae TaxID=2174228 RepID=UPI001E41C59B|nr:histidine phosphatase family protein [Albibacillus kandeliae]
MILPSRPFVLIRHGQTDANLDGIIAGRTEAQLTEAGRAAARALASWDWPEPIAIFSSPQHRARETAALAFPSRRAAPIEGFRERDWGRFEGQPVAVAPPRHQTPEGGEGWSDMIARVERALARAIEDAGAALPVIVAHSGVIRAARVVTGGRDDGPSPANTTPLLFAPTGSGWRESQLEKEQQWTA